MMLNRHLSHRRERRKDQGDCWTLAMRRARHARQRARRRKNRSILSRLFAGPEGVFLMALIGALASSVMAFTSSTPVTPPARPRPQPAPSAPRPVAKSQTAAPRQDYLPPVPRPAIRLVRDLSLLEAGHEGPLSELAWGRLRDFGENVEAYFRDVTERRDWRPVHQDIRSATARLPLVYRPASRERRLHDERALAAWACIPLWAERGRLILSPPSPPPPDDEPEEPNETPLPPGGVTP